jgi:hypothetical protein
MGLPIRWADQAIESDGCVDHGLMGRHASDKPQ